MWRDMEYLDSKCTYTNSDSIWDRNVHISIKDNSMESSSLNLDKELRQGIFNASLFIFLLEI